MISSINWVPRGAANPNPPRFQVCREEVMAMQERASALLNQGAAEEEEESEEDEEEAQGGEAKAGKGQLDRHGLPVELRMDDYDEDEAEDGGEAAPFVHASEDEEEEEADVEEGEEEEEEAEGMEDDDEGDEDDEDDDEMEGEEEEEGNLAGAAPASDFMRDFDEDDDDDGSDAEDHHIRPTDAVVLVANTEDEEHSALEVHVYEEDAGQLYVHHDITLPAFPLTLAWGDCHPMPGREGERGSYVAIGTFRPGIEIWDLDVIDPLEPSQILGGEKALHHDGAAASAEADEAASGKKGKKSKKKKGKKRRDDGDELVDGSHTGPVMSLAWNAFHRQVLASGSADATVKLWDVTTGQCSATLGHHQDKVNSLQWHPVEGTVLATAGFDRAVHVVDARGGSAASCSLAVQTDPECVGWAPHAPSLLLCSSDDGSLRAWDVRSPKAPLWSVRAHAKTCSSFAFSPLAPGLLATCGMDKIVKLWDCKEDPGSAPMPLGEKAMSVGKLFTISFYPSSPFLLATGGDKGLLALWDLQEVDAVTRRFGSPAQQQDEARQEAAAAMMEGMSLGSSAEPPARAKEDRATVRKEAAKPGKGGKGAKGPGAASRKKK